MAKAARTDGRLVKNFTVDGKRIYVYGKSEKELAEKERAARNRIDAGLIDNDTITVSAYYSVWKKYRNGTVSKSTEYTQERRFQHIKKRLGGKRVCRVSKADVVELQQSLSAELTTQGTNLVVSLFSSIMNGAVNDRIINWNPCKGVKALKRTENRARDTIHRALTEDETRAFFEAATHSWYCNFFRFLLLTGLRTGEAAALRWIDVKGDTIHITRTVSRTGNDSFTIGAPKTAAGKRDVPATDDVKAVLEAQKAAMRALFGSKVVNINDLVFTTLHGDYITASTTSNVLRAICRNAGIKYFSDHAFRDTFATRALESGMNPNTLKELLGHSSLSMTVDLYGHVMPNTKKREMDKISFGL